MESLSSKSRSISKSRSKTTSKIKGTRSRSHIRRQTQKILFKNKIARLVRNKSCKATLKDEDYKILETVLIKNILKLDINDDNYLSEIKSLCELGNDQSENKTVLKNALATINRNIKSDEMVIIMTKGKTSVDQSGLVEIKNRSDKLKNASKYIEKYMQELID